MKMYSLMMFLKRTFPLLGWIKGYDTDKAVSDLIAGITIGLTLIPQSIAYASLAGLEPQVFVKIKISVTLNNTHTL